MGRLLGKETYRELFLGVAIVLAALALVLWPREAMAAMKDGLRLCGNVIIPSLFPFFVLSSLVVELGLSRYLGKLFQPVMAPLFRVNGACASAVALGFVLVAFLACFGAMGQLSSLILFLFQLFWLLVTVILPKLRR